MSTKQTKKRASYTLFSVTQEDRESRSKRIRDFFKEQPALAYLMAAFDFEWTVRRAIILMSTCPTALVKKAMEVKKVSGLGAYHRCWTNYVQKMRKGTTPNLIEIVFDDPKETLSKTEQIHLLEKAMQLRHRLVHGVTGNIPADEAKDLLNMILSASEKITDYINDHAEKRMYARVIRRRERCKTCNKTCYPQNDIAAKTFKCDRRSKCPYLRNNGKTPIVE